MIMVMVNAFLKKVDIYGALVILIAGILAVVFWDVKILMSLILGGLLGLVNLRWIAKTVRSVLGGKDPSRAKLAVISVYLLKIGILAVLLLILLKTGRIDPLAFLAGFTLILGVIIIQGAISSMKA